MKKLDSNIIEDYDSSKGRIPGTLSKDFVRIDSYFLKDYLSQAIKPDCAYRTYIDDFVKENCKDGYLPMKFVSVLIKENRNFDNGDNSGAVKEELCSRIANLLHVPTVYNMSVYQNLGKGVKEPMNLSIDFLKIGEKIIELKNSAKINEFSSFREWEDFLQDKLNRIMGNTPRDERMKKEIMQDFAKHYLVKKYILQDIDLYPRNVSLVCKVRDRKYSLAPLFDYEHCLKGSMSTSYFIQSTLEDFELMCKKYPTQMQEFSNSLDYFFDKDGKLIDSRVRGIIRKSTRDDFYGPYFEEQLNKNIRITRGGLEYVMNNSNHIYNETEKNIAEREYAKIIGE